jgi:hypothetical protein
MCTPQPRKFDEKMPKIPRRASHSFFLKWLHKEKKWVFCGGGYKNAASKQNFKGSWAGHHFPRAGNLLQETETSDGSPMVRPVLEVGLVEQQTCGRMQALRHYLQCVAPSSGQASCPPPSCSWEWQQTCRESPIQDRIDKAASGTCRTKPLEEGEEARELQRFFCPTHSFLCSFVPFVGFFFLPCCAFKFFLKSTKKNPSTQKK